MTDIPDFSRLPPLTDAAGRLTQAGWEQLQRLIDAIRELQATAEDHEDRITDLE